MSAAAGAATERPILREDGGGSLSDNIYSQILSDILRGDYSATGKLPTESELAARFGVSRPTVREALARLRSDGVIDSRRGSGSHLVRRPGAARPVATPIRSMADIERYYDFRACIEAGAAAAAAEYRNAADLAALREGLKLLDEATRSGEFGIDADAAFHLAIARASHNPFFVAAIETNVSPIRQVMELARSINDTKSEERVRATRDEHLAVLDAIERRQPAAAAEAIREHVVNAKRRIFENALLR